MMGTRGGSMLLRRSVLATTAAVTAALSACGHTGSQQKCVATGPSPAAVTVPATPASEAPAPAAVDASQVVARVDDAVITVHDVQDRINKQSPFVRARYAATDKLREFIDSLIRFEVLSVEAQRRGYDRDPEVVRVMKQQMISKFLQQDFESRLKV